MARPTRRADSLRSATFSKALTSIWRTRARDGEFLGQLHERVFLGKPLKKWISLDQSRDMCAAPPVREGATPGVSGPVTLEVAEFQRGSVLAPVRPAVDCLPDFPAAAPTADRA